MGMSSSGPAASTQLTVLTPFPCLTLGISEFVIPGWSLSEPQFPHLLDKNIAQIVSVSPKPRYVSSLTMAGVCACAWGQSGPSQTSQRSRGHGTTERRCPKGKRGASQEDHSQVSPCCDTESSDYPPAAAGCHCKELASRHSPECPLLPGSLHRSQVQCCGAESGHPYRSEPRRPL